MKIRTMGLAELETVLGWAQQEGWNPGLEDAPAFLAADPGGFFLAEAEGAPAAAISVVNHGPGDAFLGLYICRPEHRGRGIGYALWQAALAHAGDRSVALDGVAEQEANYARSGFALQGRTVRFQGAALGGDAPVRTAGPADLPALIEADRKAAGHDRPAYAAAWLGGAPSRRTVLLQTGDGFAVFRRCHEGVKIGPFHAASEAGALALLAAVPEGFPPAPLFVDAPEGGALAGLLTGLGFAPVFGTARMVRGRPAPAAPPRYYGVATLELG